MWDYRNETLKNYNFHLDLLRDAVLYKVAHYFTKIALTLRPGIGFDQILYRW